jgi:tetratricopeptide (TPR) repeat protein
MTRKSLALIIFLAAIIGLLQIVEVDARGSRRGWSRDRGSDDAVQSEEVISRAQRPWYFYYQTGLEREQIGDWKRAKDNFIIAISLEPEPNAKKRTIANKFIHYYPYYKAANAYYHLGDIQNAERYLRVSENKKVAPRDRISGLWQLIIEGRRKPRVFMYSTVERTNKQFVDIKGIAFDYHDIVRVTVGGREAVMREATKDEVKALPYEPRLGFEPLDTVHFELLGYELRNLGENQIKVRAFATNPDRKSDLVEVMVFRQKLEEPQAPSQPAPVEEAE